jgi:hypothetical protein
MAKLGSKLLPDLSSENDVEMEFSSNSSPAYLMMFSATFKCAVLHLSVCGRALDQNPFDMAKAHHGPIRHGNWMSCTHNDTAHEQQLK